MLGVDQASVSRWEAGVQIPAFGMQFPLHDMLYRQEPQFNPTQIEALPVIVAILDLKDIGLCIPASQSFAKGYGSDARDLRYTDLKPKWTRSLLGMWDCVHGHSTVKSNSFTAGHAVALRRDNSWYFETLTPIPGSDGVLFTAANIDRPTDIESANEFKLEVLTKDELIRSPRQ